jgi:hypothetical protein
MSAISYDESGKAIEGSGKFVCNACAKSFTTNGSLKRHHERSPVCVSWLTNNSSTKSHLFPFYSFMTDNIYKSMSDDGLTCKFCGTHFSTAGNLHRHFGTSNIVCNRMAFEAFHSLIQTYFTSV